MSGTRTGVSGEREEERERYAGKRSMLEELSGEDVMGLEIIGAVVIAGVATAYLFIRFSKKNR